MDHTKEGVKTVKVYVTTDYKGCEYITMNGCAHLDGVNWRYTNEGMQIEEGKYYLRADGGKEGPMVFDGFDDIYPWRTAGFTGWWSGGGVRQNPFKRDQANLIAEWTGEPAEETGTLKEMKQLIDDAADDIQDVLDRLTEYDTPKTSSPEGGADYLLWSEMTDEEKGALLLAQHEGKVIEVFGAVNWHECQTVVWYDNCAYRVRPEPKRDTVKLVGFSHNNEWFFRERDARATHRITFDTLDGKPDYNSIKMEPIND